jgi:lipoprotein NlpI
LRAQEEVEAVFRHAVADLQIGRTGPAASGFDRVVRLAPDLAPELWQRGIALYYEGRYADCRKQFELHRTVNPNDVENAAWHFLCVAKGEGIDKARRDVLPVGADVRRPMLEIYDMLLGRLDPGAVMAATGAGDGAQFYAHFYIGVYFDAVGRPQEALTHVLAATDERYARAGGFMHDIAKIHLRALRAQHPAGSVRQQ